MIVQKCVGDILWEHLNILQKGRSSQWQNSYDSPKMCWWYFVGTSKHFTKKVGHLNDKPVMIVQKCVGDILWEHLDILQKGRSSQWQNSYDSPMCWWYFVGTSGHFTKR